jgi:hypothetical protein
MTSSSPENQINEPAARNRFWLKGRWQWYFFAIFLIAYLIASTWFNVLSHIYLLDMHENIEVRLEDAKTSDKGNIQVTFVPAQKSKEGDLEEFGLSSPGEAFCWHAPWVWVKKINLHASEEALAHIKSGRIQVGKTVYDFSGQQIRDWKKLPPADWALNQRGKRIVSLEAPVYTSQTALNMPGVNSFLIASFLPGAEFVTFFLMMLLVLRPFIHRQQFEKFLKRLLSGQTHSFDGSVDRERKTNFFWCPFILGLVVVVLGMAIMQRMAPYPFTQDDSFSQFLPVILRSAETLAQGKFPEWNPYQFLGAPTTTVGIYGLTYPPTYISYWIAHSLLKDDCATIEVFAAIHLLFGYLLTYLAMRWAGISPWIAATGGVCWILSGWFFVGGRSQSTFLGSAVFLPLMIMSITYFQTRSVSWRWAILSGTALGFYFHAGHAELWVYTMMFFTLALLLLLATGAVPRLQFLWACSAILVAVAWAAPLALLQKIETADTHRLAGCGWSADIPSTLLPLGKFGVGPIALGSIDYQFYPEMFYAGTLFTLISLAMLLLMAACGLFRKDLITSEELSKNIWLLLGGLAFIAALGGTGVIYQILSYLPIFDKFRGCIKYTPFFQLFFIFAGAVIIERLLPNKSKIKIFIFLPVCALMLFHVTLCRAPWYHYIDHPYPKLEAAIESTVLQGESKRIYAVTPRRSIASDYSNTLPLNLPTQYKILSWEGYDFFIQTKDISLDLYQRLVDHPRETARALGIGWLVWAKITDTPVLSENDRANELEVTGYYARKIASALRGNTQPTAVSANNTIYPIENADPIVFETGAPTHRLPYTLDQSGVAVNTEGVKPGTNITLNFIYWPWITATADGKDIARKSDSWNRIEVTLSEATKELLVQYSPPWGKSGTAAAVILLLGVGVGYVAQRLSKRASLVEKGKTT